MDWMRPPFSKDIASALEPEAASDLRGRLRRLLLSSSREPLPVLVDFSPLVMVLHCGVCRAACPMCAPSMKVSRVWLVVVGMD